MTPHRAPAQPKPTMLLMGVHHFFWFVWEGVVVELPVR